MDIVKNLELVLTVRNANQASAQIRKTHGAVHNYRNAVDKTAKSTHTLIEATRGGIRVFGAQGLLGAIAVVRNSMLLLSFAIAATIGVMSKFVGASIQMRNSLVGLGAVASATGQSIYGANESALDLASSGLMSVTEAAAGLKNLMATGMSLDKAKELMDALTNAAAFNRQGTLKLGEAVVGATQGFKNQLSMLLDNAGITKNISNMYDDYAKAIGTSAGKLEESQKYEAMRLGILKEATIFQGNANKLTQEYSGQVSKLNVALFELKALYGDAILPILGELVSGLQKNISETVKYVKANKDLIALDLQKYFGGLAGFITDLAKGLRYLTTEGRGLLNFFAEVATYLLLFSIGKNSFAFLEKQILKTTVAMASLQKVTIATNIGAGWGRVGFGLANATGALTGYSSAVKNAKIETAGLIKTQSKFSALMGSIFTKTNIVIGVIAALVFIVLKLKSAYEDSLKSQQRHYAELSKETRQTIDQKKSYLDLLKVKKDFIERTYNAPDRKSVIEKLTEDIKSAASELKTLNDILLNFELNTQIAGIFADIQKTADGGFFGKYVSKPFAKGASNLFNQLFGIESSKEMVKTRNEIEQLSAGLADATKYYDFYNVGLKKQQELVDDLEAKYNKLKETHSVYTENVGKLLNALRSYMQIKLAEKIEEEKDKLDKAAEAAKKYADMLKKLTDRMYELEGLNIGEREGALAKFNREMDNYISSAKELGIYDDRLKSLISHVRELGEKNILRQYSADSAKALEDRIKDVDKISQQVLKDITDAKLKAASLYSDLIMGTKLKTTGTGRSILEKIGLLPSKEEWNDIEKNYAEKLVKLDDMLENNLITQQQKETASALFLQEHLQTRQQYYANYYNNIMTMASQLMQNQIDMRYTQLETLKAQKDEELEHVRKAVQDGAITEIEAAQRVNEIKRRFDAEQTNLRRRANRELIMDTIKLTAQMIQQWAAVQMAKNAATIGNLAAVTGIGLALGAVVGIAGMALAKNMPDTTASKYDEISPSSSSEEAVRKRMGSIGQAPIMYTNIVPTISISQNGSVVITDGSVNSFVEQSTELMKQAMETAIDSGEISLDGISPK